MAEYIRKEVEIPLIWAQKVRGYGTMKNRQYEKIGEPVGPFLTGYEAGRKLNLKHFNNVAMALKGAISTANGYNFYHKGIKTFVFNIPNVEYAKKNNLLQLSNIQYTEKMLVNNLKKCGFDFELGAFEGTKSKVNVKCCEEKCENIFQTNYSLLIGEKKIPICSQCANVIAAKNKSKKNGQQSFEEAYPELKKYYHEIDNDNMKMNDISFGATTKVVLRCDKCNTLQLSREANHFKNLVGFNCFKCDSTGSQYPHLIFEWDNKNTGSLYDYSTACDERFWWNCDKGHSYQETIVNRIADGKCSRCLKIEKSNLAVQTLNKIFLEVAKENKAELNVEAIVEGTTYKNDFVLKMSTGEEIAFEYQGRIHHYNEIRVTDVPRDIIKFETTRNNGRLVILLDDFNYNNRPGNEYSLMRFSVLHALEHLKYNDFAKNCDIDYNKMKSEMTLETGKAYYTDLYNETYDKELNANLYPSTIKSVQFQIEHKIF